MRIRRSRRCSEPSREAQLRPRLSCQGRDTEHVDGTGLPCSRTTELVDADLCLDATSVPNRHALERMDEAAGE